MLTNVSFTYIKKSTTFPGSSVSFSLCERANQKEIEYFANEIEVKQKKHTFSHNKPSQITEKSCNFILDLVVHKERQRSSEIKM